MTCTDRLRKVALNMCSAIRTGILVLSALGGSLAFSADNSGVQIKELPDRLRIELNGQLFTEYFYKNVPRPYYYPVMGPGESPMTRDWPMKSPPGEEHDHPHHRSLWYAHGLVNGHDFWSEAKGFGKIVHDGFQEVKSGDKTGVIKSKDKWVAADGTVVCTDERTFKIYAPSSPSEKMFDFQITIHAPDHEVVFGDTKEGSMAIRVAESMKLKGGDGHIINSEGVRDDKTWGKNAEWCDYYGPVNGKTLGIAIFDAPSNPRHPTSWHVRDYGLFAANPFGKHDFEKLSDKSAGDFKIPAGKSATFSYRFFFHEGDEKQGKVAEQYRDYVKSLSSGQ